MASEDNQKTLRINFQTKVANVPWTFFYGLPQGTLFNPATPMSDQDRISPYNINTISTR